MSESFKLDTMQVYRGLDSGIPVGRPVVAVGSFDGVHLGHRQILQRLVFCARERGVQSVVVTFDPHPQQVLRPGSDFFTINPLHRNLELIAAEGVDVAVIEPFTLDFSRLTYAEFVEEYLIGRLHASALVMGPNHALGHDRAGNHERIRQVFEKHQVEVLEIPELTFREIGVHSSNIRNAIKNNDEALASELLGYPYKINRNQ
ncbi:MAG: hypothetical protein J5730_03935 [Bacteroidales bacterium]|nr:hypothetical protein [Bacteroidales bacterium]